MSVKPETIKLLRQKTGAGMMDCKEALSENNGDIEKAEEWLRKKGINTAQKKSSRLATEGLINVATGKKGSVIIEINSETDFVARNETFQKFCDDVATTCLENEIKDKDSLLKSNFINSNTLVETELTNVISKLGENIVIKRLNYISEPGLFYQKYLHNAISSNSGKIGVLLSFSAEDNSKDIESFTKQLCMHIAAADPLSMHIEGLSPRVVEKERAIFTEQVKSSGKPENIIEKIVDGKVRKFYSEVCFMEQTYVIDNKTIIKDCISNFNKETSLNFLVKDYLLYKLGQD
tara:strand:+ start:91 stop:963 length:873 start_codon:yes stop_codon:yes gene_type:complete